MVTSGVDRETHSRRWPSQPPSPEKCTCKKSSERYSTPLRGGQRCTSLWTVSSREHDASGGRHRQESGASLREHRRADTTPDGSAHNATRHGPEDARVAGGHSLRGELDAMRKPSGGTRGSRGTTNETMARRQPPSRQYAEQRKNLQAEMRINALEIGGPSFRHKLQKATVTNLATTQSDTWTCHSGERRQIALSGSTRSRRAGAQERGSK